MYNIGDKVIVKGHDKLSRTYYSNRSHIVFAEGMDSHIDKTFTISNIIDFHGIYPVYELEDCYMTTETGRWDWKFVDDWLEPAGPEITIDDNDVDAIFKEM